MIIVAFFGLLLFLLAVASPLHKPVRRTLHPTLVGVTIKQLPLVSATQGYCSRWLDLAVLLSAATITIEVYLTFLPLLIWSGNHHFVVCGLLPQLALAGYVVFAIKDLLESPRPADCLKLVPNAHISVRDPSGDIEDGIPSAHCCGAVSMLFYLINAAAAAGLLAPSAKPLAQAAAALWVIWLAWGRSYLGLHTPLDLATGSLLGWAVVELWGYLQGPYTAWLHASLAAPAWHMQLQVLAVSIVLMRCYPMPRRWTTCYNYATAWAAGWAGTTLGWAASQSAQAQAAAVGGIQQSGAAGAQALLQPLWGSSAAGGGVTLELALKVLFGLGCIVAAKVVTKAVLLLVLRHLFAFVPQQLRCLWQPPIVGAVQAGRSGNKPPPVVAGGKQQGQGGTSLSKEAAAAAAGSVGNSSSDDARPTQDAPRKQGGSPSRHRQAASSSSSGSSMWGLRHNFEGVANDVVATARWGSYFAVGVVISMWQVWWPQLTSRLAFSSSLT